MHPLPPKHVGTGGRFDRPRLRGNSLYLFLNDFGVLEDGNATLAGQFAF